MKILADIAGVALLVYAGLCLLVFVAQRSMIYFTVPETSGTGAVEISIASEGETISVWKVPGNVDGRSDRALIYFGGNAEAVGLNVPDFKRFFPGYTIYLVNYRGYGSSTGRPTEAGLYNDALAVYDTVAAGHGSIAVIGRSLGSGVATYLAANRPVSKLALIAPFDSLVNVAAHHYSIFPVRWLLKDRYESIGRVDRIDCPVLIIVATRDRVIPPERSYALASAFPPSQMTVRLIEGADHNDLGLYPEFGSYLQRFME